MKKFFLTLCVSLFSVVSAFAQGGQTTTVRTATTDPTVCVNGAEIYGNTASSEYKGCTATNTFEAFATKPGIQKGTYNYATDSGAANVYVVTLTPAPSSLTVGLGLYFKATNVNTGASTLAVNGLTATTIVKYGSTALVAGDIAAGKIYHVVYDGTNFEMIGLPGNAPAGSGNVSNSGTPTAGQSAEFTDPTHIQGIATAGGGISYIKGTLTSLAQSQVLCADATPKLVNCSQGVGGRSVSAGPDTIVAGDRLATITYTSGSAVATSVTSAATLGNNFAFGAKNEGAGDVTLTLGAGAWSTGGTTLVLHQGDNCTFNSPDNTNFLARCSPGQITAGANITLTKSPTGLQIASTAGGGTVTTTGSPASPNLSCFSGSASITNCANVSAHQFRGNNTGSGAPEIPSLIGASDVSPNVYAAGAGTAQAQTVTLTPAATALTSGLTVCWKPAAANTGAAPTLAVSGLTATAITKLGTTALVANDLTTTAIACVIYDGTQFELQNPQTASAGGTPTYPVTVAGTVNSGGIPCFTSTTQESSSGLMTTNVYMKGGGVGVCPSPGLTTDDGTSSTYTGTGGTKSPSFTTNGTTAGFTDYPQGPTSAAVAPCNVANSICEQAPTAVTPYLLNKPGAAPTIASYKQTDTCGSAVCTESFHPVPIVLRVTADFTDTSSTALQAITGLGFTFPANQALNAKVDCDILYNQTVAAVADAWGVQDVTVAPTNVEATGFTQTAATTWAEQQLLTLTTTTATNIGTFTPSAITTVWHAQIHALVEHPSNASTSAFNIMVSQSTAADLMVIKRGSACTVTFQ